jgi:Fe2+ or Zn2+ uptake regulation protein
MIKESRMTEQKRAIYEYLKSVKSHPTAEEIYKAVRRKLRQLSLATVYRVLNSLLEQNLILEIPDLEGKGHFDGFIQAHDHCFCEKCRRVYDLNKKSVLKNYFKKTFFKKGFKINSYQLIFFGKCCICQKNNSKQDALIC